MSLIAIGLSHKSATLELREKMTFDEDQFAFLRQCLHSTEKYARPDIIQESAVISTCNRLELYGVTDSPPQGIDKLMTILSEITAIPVDRLRPYLYQYQGEEVVRHLMQVAAGLDSLVLGEPQILGQIVAAHRRARVDKTTQQILSRLFEMAIRTGKRARTETTISANAASVSSIAVRLAASHLSGLEGRTVAVLGAGKMGRLTIQSLLEKGTHEILIASRTLSRAQTLAEQWQLDLSPTRLNHARLKAKALETLPEILTAADVIISSTSAPHIVLDCEAVARAMVQRPDRPLIIVDIALPRDVEPGVADLPGVHLYNIDNLEAHVAENLRMRAGEIPKVETIISEETDAFMSWYRSRSVVPTITAFRSEFEKIKEQELERTLKRLNHLAEDDQELVAELAHRLVNKFLHQPTVQLKEAAAQGDGAVMRETLHQLFELEMKSSK